jgi:hypothetical protein
MSNRQVRRLDIPPRHPGESALGVELTGADAGHGSPLAVAGNELVTFFVGLSEVLGGRNPSPRFRRPPSPRAARWSSHRGEIRRARVWDEA